MRKKFGFVILPLTFAVLIAATSCGYHLSGKGDLVPKTARTIAIPVFINKTNEPFVDTEITRAVVKEFLTDGRLQVVGLEGADLALRGKVVKYTATPVSYTPTLTIQQNSYVQEYQVQMTVDVVLEDLKSQKILWEEKGIETVFISNYSVGYDSLTAYDSGTGTFVDIDTKDKPSKTVNIEATKISKEKAIGQASRDIASTLRSRILEGF